MLLQNCRQLAALTERQHVAGALTMRSPCNKGPQPGSFILSWHFISPTPWVTRQPWERDKRDSDTKSTQTRKSVGLCGPPSCNWQPATPLLAWQVFYVHGLETLFPHLEAPACPGWRHSCSSSSIRRDKWEPQRHKINPEDQHNSTQALKIRLS